MANHNLMGLPNSITQDKFTRKFKICTCRMWRHYCIL